VAHQDAIAYQSHDHHHCIEGAMKAARQLCRQRGVQLTGQREAVLRLVWQSHRPVGAYDLLGQLPDSRNGRKPAPTTVYRALDFLREHGLVHRLDSLNAYIGCPHPGQQHDGVFLICRHCRHVQELPGERVHQALKPLLTAQGFSPDALLMEIPGVCPRCQPDGEGT